MEPRIVHWEVAPYVSRPHPRIHLITFYLPRSEYVAARLSRLAGSQALGLGRLESGIIPTPDDGLEVIVLFLIAKVRIMPLWSSSGSESNQHTYQL